MTKYSFEFKKQIVADYFENKNSIIGLSKEYKVPYGVLQRWIHQARVNGVESLAIRRHKSKYSTEFKLDVVRYYLNNSNLGVTPVAANFNIDPSQVYAWTKRFEENGITGLLPKRKGRPTKMSRKPKKKQIEKVELTERQKYEEKIIKQEAEIERLKLENLVLKKVAARYPRYPTKKKQ